MKNISKKILQLTTLVSLSTALLADSVVVPQLNFRSPGRDTVDKVVGTSSHHVHLFDMESYYGTFWMTPKYAQSFRPSRICSCLFGDVLVTPAAATNTTTGTTTTTMNNSCNRDRDCGSNGCTIAIQGDAVASTTPNFGTALAAENFLLAHDFNGEISFKPQVRNFSLDFHFYMALDEWVEGLFFRIYGPFVHTRYNLNYNENVISAGTTAGGYAAGYFDSVAVPQANLLQSFTAYAQGGTISYTGSTVTVRPLQFAKIPCGALTENYFGELRFELGYNFLLNEDYHLGVMLEAAAPTGKRPNAEFLFSPNNGGKHWQLGGGVTGHYTLWRSEDEEKHFDFVVEADINHWFKSKETRTFDLKGKGLSRYLLAEQLTAPAVNLSTGTPAVAPALQFAGVYSPVANFSTVRAKVSVNVETDLVAMFNFTARGFSWDIGYNFWYRGCEKINVDCFTTDKFAIKGNASVFGFDTTTTPATAVALSATSSTATIQGGPNTGAAINGGTNANIDSPALAFTNPATGAPVALYTDATTGVQINTSTTPVVLTINDLDIDGARSKGQSNKIFTHFNYTWVDREDWVPYIGAGADVEFGSSRHNSDSSCPSTTTTTTTSTTMCGGSSCHRCALTQWGVWIKGGLSFN